MEKVAKQGQKVYDRTLDPLVVEEWIRHIEKYLI